MKYIFNVDRLPGLWEVQLFEDTAESAAELGVQRFRDEDSGERYFWHLFSGRFLPLGWEMIREVGAELAQWIPTRTPLAEQPDHLELSEKLVGEPPVVVKS